jgi:hypothetical protein
LLAALALSFRALQRSSKPLGIAAPVQAGHTALVTSTTSPDGPHTGPPAPPLRRVTWRRLAPSASATQSWPPLT